ncbi:MAG: DUF2384 domain-containing protein [Salinarimonadaceae bacterium]|nr:MAG: DUF2384 domain-containing protein [Salinarimonadaceae bacterium]
MLQQAEAGGRRYIPDLSDAATRADLTPAALEGFVSLVDIWRLTGAQAAQLLGDASPRTWFRIKAGQWEGTLSQDELTRISALVGLYKGLHLLFSESLANEWVRKANRGEPFDGRAPLQYMIEGGIPAMLETRRHIDALRGGM